MDNIVDQMVYRIDSINQFQFCTNEYGFEDVFSTRKTAQMHNVCSRHNDNKCFFFIS